MMKTAKLAILGLLGMATQVYAAPMVQISSFLPPVSAIFAPVPDFVNVGTASTVSPGDPAGLTYLGLTQSYPGVARSPFETVAGYQAAPYDSVSGGGLACFGFCGSGPTPPPSSTSFTFGTDAFSFIYGSPDTYNTLTLFTSTGTFTYTGSQLVTPPSQPSQMGYEFVQISGLGQTYGAQFESRTNAFEFAAVSAVPLPASLPLFGGSLLALAGFSYGMNRWVAPKNRKARTAA